MANRRINNIRTTRVVLDIARETIAVVLFSAIMYWLFVLTLSL